MCCDICPQHEECEAGNRLKENCCRQCPEYEYCTEEERYKHNKHSHYADDSDIDLYD